MLRCNPSGVNLNLAYDRGSGAVAVMELVFNIDGRPRRIFVFEFSASTHVVSEMQRGV